MKEEPLTPYSVRLRPDQIATIQQLNINLSDWSRRKFDEDFMSPEEIDKNIKNLQEQIERLKLRKIMANRKIEERKNISENEIDFLLETKEIIERDPEYLDGRIGLYLNKFGKPFKISRKEFYDLLERVTQIQNGPELRDMNNLNNEKGGEDDGT